MGFMEWLGLAIMATAAIAFCIQLVHVLRGSKPAGTLVNEAIHDGGLFCLGLSGLLAANQPVRDVLFGAALLALGVYLVRRYAWRGGVTKKEAPNKAGA